MELTWADEEPLLFLTVDSRTKKIITREKRKQLEREYKKLETVVGDEAIEQQMAVIETLKDEIKLKPNFRLSIAKRVPYKSTRSQEKPLHYNNLTAYIINNYNCVLAEGYEADDLMCIYQQRALDNGEETIICTRDKDLRMCPGNHFGWACGEQPAFGPELVDEVGRHIPHYDKNGKMASLRGTGMSLFCSQLLTGDTVDAIPGLPRVGPVKALKLLDPLHSYPEKLKAVVESYRDKYGDSWKEEFMEQAQLLWMVRYLDEDGSPIMFELPEWIDDC